MGKYDKLLFQILSGTSDANIAFEDLHKILLKLGFEERKSIPGSASAGSDIKIQAWR
ncbi:MAG: hypothetical protein K9J79_11105 [Desulfobacteraceae bacterium]|nr:hypothetical protein [Desulfobacteraceae bacterium]